MSKILPRSSSLCDILAHAPVTSTRRVRWNSCTTVSMSLLAKDGIMSGSIKLHARPMFLAVSSYERRKKDNNESKRNVSTEGECESA